MMSFKLFVTCACIVLVNAEDPELTAKLDSSAGVDPYAAYYEHYANQASPVQNDVSYSSGLNSVYAGEKQGYAATMEGIMGEDAALVLGTIGALMGTLAAVGVVLNNNNVNELSLDQDSICTMTQAIGATSLTTAAIASTSTANAAADTALATEVNAALNLIITQINAYATPDCN